MNYTPPEPFRTDADGEEVYVFHQLRSEVERVRRETVEDCAMKMESQHTWLTNAAAANIIRSLK